MSVDLGWSYSQLTKPLERHLNGGAPLVTRPAGTAGMGSANSPMGNWLQRIIVESASHAMRLPTKGPQGRMAMSNLEQAVQGMFQPNPQAAQPNLVQPAQAQPGGTPRAPQVTQPGVDPGLATQVPEAPKDGVPKLPSVSGWIAPGGNFSFTKNPF